MTPELKANLTKGTHLTRQKILNPPRFLISRNNYKTIESNMSMEGNGGSESCIEMPKAKNDRHLKREEYTHVATRCLEAILELASLIPTGETDSNESKVLYLFILIDLDIIQLKNLFDHLSQNTQNSPKTLFRWEEQIKFYHDWVEVLRVRQNVLAKKKPTYDIE